MIHSWQDLPLKVSKDSLKPNPSNVGKAVYDILSKPQGPQEVGETIDAMGARYYQELFDTVKSGKKIYDDPFYVVVLRKKESWALNVLRQWYISRQTKPQASYLRHTYPNHDHDLWKVQGDNLSLEWTLPTEQDSRSIMKNKDFYDEKLVKWIEDYNRGSLL